MTESIASFPVAEKHHGRLVYIVEGFPGKCEGCTFNSRFTGGGCVIGSHKKFCTEEPRIPGTNYNSKIAIDPTPEALARFVTPKLKGSTS